MPRRFWTSREIQLLADRYQAEGSGRLAQDLGRSGRLSQQLCPKVRAAS